VQVLAVIAALIAAAGVAQACVGWLAMRRFAAMPLPPAGPRPPITVLKPLCGDESMLEAALASFCAQDYPGLQLVCGVQDPADPAIAVVRRLQARFPDRDIALVIDPTQHGENRKVGNLINMLPMARHDVLVIADSDVHAAPDYLALIADTLALPRTGVVTALYTGLPANRSLAARLGATAINHLFLPGVLLSRLLGRQDCLGPTMALRRDTLAAIGGLGALANHVADDNILGRLVLARGLLVRLTSAVCAVTVQETGLRALLRHELRWMRTIRTLVPAAFAASAIQLPLAWAALAVAFSAGASWALAGFVLVWAAQAAVVRGVDAQLRLVQSGLVMPVPIWLLPLRDLLGLAAFAVSYTSDRVEWRGHILHTRLDKPGIQAPQVPPDGDADVAAPLRVAANATFGESSR
jgi:ceramide glucosyltransferase